MTAVMTKEHENILRTNRVILVDKMEPDHVINHLRSTRVLTDGQVDKIKAKGTRREQVECLLDILVLRPDTAFDALVHSLEATEQENLADLLTGNTGDFSCRCLSSLQCTVGTYN